MNKFMLAVCMVMIGLVAILGLYLFLKGARRVQLAIASTKWPTTAGKIIGSETTRDVSAYRRQISVTFNTETRIGYTVDGKEYSTDVLHFGQSLGSGDKSDAEVKRLRFPAGKDVPVSYNPANPSLGVMKPGLHADAFWLPGAGLAFLLPSLLCIFLLPSLFHDTTAEDKAFADYVESAIQTRNPNLPPPPPRSSDKVMPIAAAAFGAVFCCLGILALTAGLQRYWHGSASMGWPKVPGVVIKTGLDEPDDSTDTAYRARMIYKYDVQGATHFNNLRSFAQVESIAHYKTGDHVKVSYFPTDPDISVLEPGNSNEALWMPGIGVVLLLFSLAVFVWVVPAVGKS